MFQWSEFHEDLARKLSRLSTEQHFPDRMQDARLAICKAIYQNKSPFYAKQILLNESQKIWGTLRSKVDLSEIEYLDRFKSNVMSPHRYTELRELLPDIKTAEMLCDMLDKPVSEYSIKELSLAQMFIRRF